MSGKSDKTKGGKPAQHQHKDKDLEHWAKKEKAQQHPGEFGGPLKEVDMSADVEAAKHRHEEYEKQRAEQKKKAHSTGSQHPGEFKGPLAEVDLDPDEDPEQ
jgi:hypothetical protein